METLLQDVNYAIRQLRDHRSFAVIAILTLALGIGVSTALFSVIDAALLRPLPYPNPEELVTLSVEEMGSDGKPSQYGPSMADIRAWRAVGDTVAHAGMGRVTGFSPLIVETGTPQRLIVAEVSEGFLETYGVAPIVGRSITVDDTRKEALGVALLGHAFWMQEYGGDRAVLGRTIRIQNDLVTIVGVLPAGFYNQTAIWQARQFAAEWLDRRGSGTPAIARLRPGVTRAHAAAALSAVTPAGTTASETPVPARAVVESMYDDETFGFAPTIRTLSWAVALVLVIACVNVAGLMFAPGATRDVEFAIRTSMGAGRMRLVRQLLTESLVLAVTGAGVGVLLAYVSLDWLVALIPLSLPANSPVAINTSVLAFALGLTMVTALVFGLLPAVKLSRPPSLISTTLSAGGRSRARLSTRAGQWLIGIEVALALVLMTGSGLILRSFARLLAVDLGFEASNVLTFEVEPLDQTYSSRRLYYTSFADSLRQLPEVASVGAISQMGLRGGGFYGFPTADTGEEIPGFHHTVLPGYFQAMGVAPLAGRLLEDADRASGEAVVVNEMTARQHFGGNAVGHRLRTSGKYPKQWRIVGVIPNIKHGGPHDAIESTMYILPDPSTTAMSEITLAMVIRLRGEAAMSLDRLKQMAEAIGPRVLVGDVTPAAALVSEQVAEPRHRMQLLTLFGAFGLLLTLVGIFSMTAYAVSRRTREIGVRLAIGARPAHVVSVMVRDAIWPVALGLGVGLVGTYYATRIIAAFLFQIEPHDPATLAGVVAILGAAAFLAAWLPARRAASVDPVTALRAE